MGRRLRIKRRRKQAHTGFTAENDCNIISLNKCVMNYHLKKCKKLRLFNFRLTGRGVMAMEKIDIGDVMLEIPFDIILSMFTLELDKPFQKLLLPAFIQTDKKMFSCQQMLAFYVSYVKITSTDSFWATYVKTMPKEFTVPYFSQCEYFCTDVSDVIKKQKEEIVCGYNCLIQILHQNEIALFEPSFFTLDLYSWAYFVVNSRCVYLCPKIVSNLMLSHCVSNDFCILNILNDAPNLGLIPFLDMFNHSPLARTEAVLSLQSGQSQPVFKLTSLTNYQKFDQIYIFYGSHTNLRLFTEYGFCIPSNPFSNIPLKLDDLIIELGLNPNQEKYKYIKKHNLDACLFIDANGLSYNLIRCLLILGDSNKSTWDSKIYSSFFEEKEMSQVCSLLKPLVHNKFSLLNSLLSCNAIKEDIGSEYKILIQEYLHLLTNIL